LSLAAILAALSPHPEIPFLAVELERRLSSGKWNCYVDLAFAVAAKSKK
jgi:hypothetical protein